MPADKFLQTYIFKLRPRKNGKVTGGAENLNNGRFVVKKTPPGRCSPLRASIDREEARGRARPNLQMEFFFFVACSLHLIGLQSNHLLEGVHDNIRKLSSQYPVRHRRVAWLYKTAQGQRVYLSGREWGKNYRQAGT